MKWKYHGSKTGANTEYRTQEETTHELIINGITKRNAGKYSCYSEHADVIYVGVGELKIKGMYSPWLEYDH